MICDNIELIFEKLNNNSKSAINLLQLLQQFFRFQLNQTRYCQDIATIRDFLMEICQFANNHAHFHTH